MRNLPRQLLLPLLTAALTALTPAPAVAEEPPADLQTEVRALREEVRRLRARVEENEDNWMDERRAEQVRRVVAEVLADADARPSLGGRPITAGHDGRFFLMSEDGDYRLNVSGQVQVRYVANLRRAAESRRRRRTTAFEIRRAKLNFTGHVGDPRFRFVISPSFSRDGRLGADDLHIAYDFDDEWTVTVGRKKVPFFREGLHSSSRQLALERSLVNSEFGGGRSTGVEVSYRGSDWRAAAMVSEGFNQNFREFGAPVPDAGVTARGDLKLAGDWSQHADFAAWESDPFGAFLGAAVHYEFERKERPTDFVTWTADSSVHWNRLGLFAAVAGRHETDVDQGPRFDDLGLLAQAGYTIDDRFQPFARYELLLPDSARGATDIHIITAGLNYFFRGHSLKWTTDLVWVLDPLDNAGDFRGGSGGLGLLTDAPGRRRQAAIRSQFQLLF